MTEAQKKARNIAMVVFGGALSYILHSDVTCTYERQKGVRNLRCVRMKRVEQLLVFNPFNMKEQKVAARLQFATSANPFSEVEKVFLFLLF